MRALLVLTVSTAIAAHPYVLSTAVARARNEGQPGSSRAAGGGTGTPGCQESEKSAASSAALEAAAHEGDVLIRRQGQLPMEKIRQANRKKNRRRTFRDQPVSVQPRKHPGVNWTRGVKIGAMILGLPLLTAALSALLMPDGSESLLSVGMHPRSVHS